MPMDNPDVAPAPPRHRFAVLLGLAVVYYVTAWLGLRVAYVHPSATPVWAPTGIALAALLTWGRSVWPAIFVGAFAVNLSTEGNVATAAGIALGNTLEGLIGAHMLHRLAKRPRMFADARDVFYFVVFAGGLATSVSATLGFLSLLVTGYAAWSDVGLIWLTWWLGDFAGAVIVAPLLLTWARDPSILWPEERKVEAVVLLAALVVMGQLVFGGVLTRMGALLPLEFLVVPVLLWAGVRFTPREAATATFLIAAIALRGTFAGLGPFAHTGPDGALILVQSFMVVSAASTLMLAAVVAERRNATLELQRLSESDGLTGLANYRGLHEMMTLEIHRYGRTNRSFALLLLDLDELKKINDNYGHVTGNRALVRVAEAMRAACRAVDTPGRFGGDEFALILPETDVEEAWAVADRIRERLAATTEEPKVSLSCGVASYPRDGDSPGALIEHADRALYAMKREPRKGPRARPVLA
jgi:diguanylate cyclase (GGDEF)-like protein